MLSSDALEKGHNVLINLGGPANAGQIDLVNFIVTHMCNVVKSRSDIASSFFSLTQTKGKSTESGTKAEERTYDYGVHEARGSRVVNFTDGKLGLVKLTCEDWIRVQNILGEAKDPAQRALQLVRCSCTAAWSVYNIFCSLVLGSGFDFEL